MKYLYERNKQKVFSVAYCLLVDQQQASDMVAAAFKNIWSRLSALEMQSEDHFTALAVRKTAEYCRRAIQKKDANAFRTPQNKNFLIQPDWSSCNGDVVDHVLSQLPPFQRFVLVLRTVGGMNAAQVAASFNLTSKAVHSAANAEKDNLTRILSRSELDDSMDCAKLILALFDREKNTDIPQETDDKVYKIISNLSDPFEKKRKRQWLFVGGAAALLCVCIVIFVAGGTGGNSDSGTADDGSLTYTEGTGSSDTDEDLAAENDLSIASDGGSTLDADLTYYADIEIQDYGTITVQLDPASAPITAENFVALAESGFYDGLTFHRIKEAFMMQGGDPNGDGTGGSETSIVGEFPDNGYENDLSHTRGAISMARSDDYDSASSQFFIVHEDSTYLDGQYAVFGYVTEGMEIVDAVCEAAEPMDENGTIPSEAQPVISSITIRVE